MSSPNAKSRIGLFGGSFDPIHNGHLAIARMAAQQFSLDRVVFIPAAQSPLKSDAPCSTDSERIEMIHLAIQPFSGFEISTIEIDRGGISYSIDTVESLSALYPDCDLFWIIGGDQARQLDRWRRIEELARKVEFICLERDRETEVPAKVSSLTTVHSLKLDRIHISSTEIREQARSGALPKYFLPEPVFHYIKSRNLYRVDPPEHMTSPPKLSTDYQQLLGACCHALDETKAEDIVILDVGRISSITNYLILATANSQPHLKALKRDLDKTLKDLNVRILGVDEGEQSGWSVVDAFDVMIHLFTPEMRENYDLETLWRDASEVEVESLLATAEKRPAARES